MFKDLSESYTIETKLYLRYPDNHEIEITPDLVQNINESHRTFNPNKQSIIFSLIVPTPVLSVMSASLPPPSQQHAPSTSITFSNHDNLLPFIALTSPQLSHDSSFNAITSYQTSSSSSGNSQCNIPSISPFITEYETSPLCAVNNNFQSNATYDIASPQRRSDMYNNNLNVQDILNYSYGQ
ncbi:13229_t:CDS:2 [Dentiscutata erythropus]|uniref:13229_t:CDS:1 n=1 Tax=Dentiscutata erythropus TaxID=1348616 RepID=A0A9N9CJU5_9GLOM|nr:13229_t:CDS:2 [Dentiscutata erythropus]